MLKQIINEKNRILELKSESELERNRLKATKIENTIEYMTAKIMDCVNLTDKAKTVSQPIKKHHHKKIYQNESQKKNTKKSTIIKELEFCEEDQNKISM